MSQPSCSVCSYESFDSYNWAIQNPWFRKCSSLAAALGEQETQELPSQYPLAVFVVPEGYREHEIPPTTLDDLEGHQHQDPEGVEPEPAPVPTTSGLISGDHNVGGSSLIVADLQGEVPLFCRVGRCRFWHTDRKQVKRHRDFHFRYRFRWSCPNKAGSCKSSGRRFGRKDAVTKHCRKYPKCGAELEAIGGNLERQGQWANERDLGPYDPTFHIPYRKFDGRTGRR